jgi:hypothetical protein
MPIRKGQTEIEVSEQLEIDHADSQGISEKCVLHNGGNIFHKLLLG